MSESAGTRPWKDGMYRNADGSYTLSSGRRLAAPLFDVIGIGADCGAEGEIPWGADGAWQVDGRHADVTDTPEEQKAAAAWTPAERAELATEMIRRWLVFAGPETRVRMVRTLTPPSIYLELDTALTQVEVKCAVTAPDARRRAPL